MCRDSAAIKPGQYPLSIHQGNRGKGKNHVEHINRDVLAPGKQGRAILAWHYLSIKGVGKMNKLCAAIVAEGCAGYKVTASPGKRLS